MTLNDSIKKWNEFSEEADFQDNLIQSETDIRCKIIDHLLTKVLFWKERNIQREPKIKAGFIDYFCKTENNNFVLEAKSNKVDFNLPKHSKLQRYSSSAIKKTKPDLWNAIDQARAYAKEKESSLCVISNGLNLIFCTTYPADRAYDTLALSGVDAFNKNFHHIYELISPYKNGFNNIEEILELKVYRQAPLFRKSIADEAYRNDNVGNNPLSAPLTTILTTYFSDISHDKQLLKQLYCNNVKLDSYGNDLKNFIKGRIPLLGLPFESNHSLEVSDESAGGFHNDIFRRMQEKKHLKQGHVFVLFGNLGAGKSTFIHRFYNHFLKGYTSKIVWCQVDFRSFYNTDEDIQKKIEDKILQDLEKSLEDINQIDIYDYDFLVDLYKSDIDKKTRGAWKYLTEFAKNENISKLIDELQNDRKAHIEKIISYLVEKDYELFLVLDNLDQQTTEVQEKASFYGLAKSTELRITTILSLRDETYWSMKTKPPMDAYGNITAYQIVPPSVREVLMKRINYVKEITGNEEVHFDFYNVSVRLKYKDLLNLLSQTLRREEVEDLLVYLSSGNLRYSLELFRDIVTSGHSKLVQLLNYKYEEEKPQNQTIPFNRLVRSVGLSTGLYYDTHKSKLLNLFQSNTFDGFGSHFINIRILDILMSYKDKQIRLGTVKGFVPLEDILKDLSIYCNNMDSLKALLSPMLERHIIESDIGARRMGEDNFLDKISLVRIAPPAQFHLETLLKSHEYLEMILYDTKFEDEDVFNKIYYNFKIINHKNTDFKVKWDLRFKSVELFLKYLKDREDEDFKYLGEDHKHKFKKISSELISNYSETKRKIMSTNSLQAAKKQQSFAVK
ncbi:P-loop NTPase fold protein [Bacillus altitudinis]|uniref:P-loop NTPase fold protein n=1 Tax=Bacillus altitudinis TaxID=293387 RepID=UPI0039BFDD2A